MPDKTELCMFVSVCRHIMYTLCSIAVFYNLILYSNDGLRLTSWCVYSRGQSKLQACGEVWKCMPIITVSAITGTSLYAAANC